jgi:hypothetical protein
VRAAALEKIRFCGVVLKVSRREQIHKFFSEGRKFQKEKLYPGIGVPVDMTFCYMKKKILAFK